MGVYDLIMLTVLAGATALGALKGLAWQLASLGSMLLSYIVAVQLRQPVSRLIDAAPPWNQFAAMLILYVGTSLVIWTGFRFVAKTIDVLKLKAFDRQIGALFGFAKGVVLCVIVTLFAVTVLGHEQKQTVVQSRSGYYIAELLDRADAVIPDEYHAAVQPYLNKLDMELQARRDERRSGEEAVQADSQMIESGQGGAAGSLSHVSTQPAQEPAASPPLNPRYAAPNEAYNPPYVQTQIPPASSTATSDLPPFDPYHPPSASIGPSPTMPSGRAPPPSRELLNLPALLRESLR